MKQKRISMLGIMISLILISGCSNKQLEEANTVIKTYNDEVKEINEMIVPYNMTVDEIQTENKKLEACINNGQEILNKNETPYDENTLVVLKEKISKASQSKVTLPEKIDEYEVLSVDQDAKKRELQSLIEDVNLKIEELDNFTIPEIPSVPDYSTEIENLDVALLAYQESVQVMKQITASSDEFVIERLQLVDTITGIEAVSENNDPNGQLNKQGGYIGCIYFTDTQVNRDELYIESGQEGIIDVGTDGGGAVEIYKTQEEAETRNTYLGGFDGTIFSSGSHYIYGTLLIRTSRYLTGTQQLELTDKIVQSLITVK